MENHRHRTLPDVFAPRSRFQRLYPAWLRAAIFVAAVSDMASCSSGSTASPDPPSGDSSADGRAISVGLGTKQGGGTGMCTPTEDRYIDGDFGVITARDGRQFSVPGPIHAGSTCTDLHNPCAGGQNPNYQTQLQTIVVDDTPDAVEITGYIYADNYFELYVNGKYVCRDALNFVPFNSHVVRVKARYPLTIGLLGIDWEQSLGVGVELNRGVNSVGDAGITARFVDANGKTTVTSTDWRCLPYYVAPLDDPGCVAADRDSSSCAVSAACVGKNPATCQAVLWPVPADWAAPSFNDSTWPLATRYTAAQVGPKTAYTVNAALFQGADFIWSKNLFTDNLVMCRKTVTP